MKLQKVVSRTLNKKEYAKWLMIVPPKDVEELGWKDGQKLKTLTEKGKLIISISKEPSYEEFKTKIFELLNTRTSGFGWQEIKSKLSLEQAVPNNRWVNKLEIEIGLRRKKENNIIYWYLDKKGITVFTIGYEGIKIDEFIKKLKEHKIEQLADVREIPLSRKNGFSKSVLKEAINKENIVYKHFSELGSPKELRHKLWTEGNYPEFFKEYTNWLSKPEAQEYLTDLEGLSHVRRTAIMCFEKDVEKCHRSIIKKRLIADGFKVVDI